MLLAALRYFQWLIGTVSWVAALLLALGTVSEMALYGRPTARTRSLLYDLECTMIVYGLACLPLMALGFCRRAVRRIFRGSYPSRDMTAQ